MNFDKIIIGAGLYGLYSALYSARKWNEKILVIEYDDAPFKRATYINQARVHMGYHYPRSISTAKKSANYFSRFNEEFGFSIHSDFEQIYAISKAFSWTNAEQFMKFCRDSKIPCEYIKQSKYFKEDMCEGAFLTKEYTYDAQILKNYFVEELGKFPNVEIIYSARINDIVKHDMYYSVSLANGSIYNTDYLLNASYASVNQIINKLGYEEIKIKYELCEIILCKVSDELKDIGFTVMDGPFFSIMPFGKTGYHSLTSVTFTPHKTSYESLPTFECQNRSDGFCAPTRLANCNECVAKPISAWPYMSNLARKYMKGEYGFEYIESLFSMKPILMASEIDDSRPTVVKEFTTNPKFVSVLSGKINTIYDLEEILDVKK